MEAFYKVIPVCYVILAILLLLAGIQGQSRTGKSAWTLIIVSGVFTLLATILTAAMEFNLVKMEGENSYYMLSVAIEILQIMGSLFLVIGLFQIGNEKREERGNSFR